MTRAPEARSTVALTFLAVVALSATARDAAAQAWVPPRGMGVVSLTYQRINTTGHRRTNGFLVERGQSINMGLYLEGEYAITDRLSVSAGLPYVFAKYTATIPPAPPIPYPPEDECHCWNSSLAGLRLHRPPQPGLRSLCADTVRVGRDAEPRLRLHRRGRGGPESPRATDRGRRGAAPRRDLAEAVRAGPLLLCLRRACDRHPEQPQQRQPGSRCSCRRGGSPPAGWCPGSARTADCVSDRRRLRTFPSPATSTRRSAWRSTIG